MGRESGVGPEFSQPIGGMRRQPPDDILEVGEGIALETLAAHHRAGHGRCRPVAAITSNESVVFASNGLIAHKTFRDVVVDAQFTVAGGDLEIVLLVWWIPDG
jgi:hypothetical protein